MILSALFAVFLWMIPQAGWAIEIGSDAPDFSVKSSAGGEVKLSDFKGKVVVLEWLNHGCPFVKKHYSAKNMQGLQAEMTKGGAVWLSIISSAKGEQGHSSPDQAEADRKKHGSGATAILLDESGVVGRAYGAKTTPHMYVIDRKGKLVYQGAIDDQPSTDRESLAKVKVHFLQDAARAAIDGKAVSKAQTQAYGCSVKYN